MPRLARHAPGGLIYHVLNRAAGRLTLFRDADDYLAFLRVLVDVREEANMRVLGFCIMPNHWHLVLWPERDGDLARFMQKLTITHVRRWVEHRRRVGYGSVYQGRYKSFPMQDNEHFHTVMRYVERNPLRSNLVRRAEKWKWSSLGQPTAGSKPAKLRTVNQQTEGEWPVVPLFRWPVARPGDWVEQVNRVQTEAEAESVKRAITHSRPLGNDDWRERMEKRLGLGPLRGPGRPAKGV